MPIETHSTPVTRSLGPVFREQLENALECGEALGQLFSTLHEPDETIARIKQLEERGDRLTLEAHNILDSLPYSENIQIIQQLVVHLDDIVDGMNNVARIVDIFTPTEPQETAHHLLETVLSMVEALRTEIEKYPDNDLAEVRACRAALKFSEEKADNLYHQWRKSHRRHGTLSLISETDWTEILGILEQTTDACYHGVLSLERITQYRLTGATG